MLDFMHNLFLESDYIDDYEMLGVNLCHETRFAHVVKDHELIEGYQILADTKEIIRLPYYDSFIKEILTFDLSIEYVNILDDYVELVLEII